MVGVADHGQLGHGERRIVDRHLFVLPAQDTALRRIAADAVHAGQIVRGVVAPDFPDECVARAEERQRQRAQDDSRGEHHDQTPAALNQ